MNPLLVVLIVVVLLIFFGAGIAAGYILAKRGFQKRLVVLNTPDDYREQGARLLAESLLSRNLISEKALRSRAFEHFRMAETIEHTQPVPVIEDPKQKA